MYAPYIEKTEKKKRNVKIIKKIFSSFGFVYSDFSFSTKVVAK